MAAGFVVMNVQIRLTALLVTELLAAQLFQRCRGLRHADGMDGTGEFAGEETGSDVVVARVHGEDQRTSRVFFQILEVAFADDLPVDLALKMKVPKPVKIGQRKLEEDLKPR